MTATTTTVTSACQLLEPPQEITETVTIQRVLDFEAALVPHLNAESLLVTMRSGGYDVMLVTRTQGGGLTVRFGWDYQETA